MASLKLLLMLILSLFCLFAPVDCHWWLGRIRKKRQLSLPKIVWHNSEGDRKLSITETTVEEQRDVGHS